MTGNPYLAVLLGGGMGWLIASGGGAKPDKSPSTPPTSADPEA